MLRRGLLGATTIVCSSLMSASLQDPEAAQLQPDSFWAAVPFTSGSV